MSDHAELTDASKLRTIIGPTILLNNGQYFDFLDPGASEWGVEELAEPLAKLCRFAGWCEGHYSVAEHSVLASLLVPPEHRLAALLHDAHEAFIGDTTYPLKQLVGDAIRPIEARIDAVLFPRFGLSLPLDPSIKLADRKMLWIEQRALMGNRDDWSATSSVSAFEAEIARPRRWPWQMAKEVWLSAVQNELAIRADAARSA